MINMRQSKHVASEGLGDELGTLWNPLAPLRDTPGMTFDEVKIQIECKISDGIQKLPPVSVGKESILGMYGMHQARTDL